MDLSKIIGNVLGEDAVKQLAKVGVDLSKVEKKGTAGGSPETVLDFNLASETLGKATAAVRERFKSTPPKGPTATVSAPLPEEVEEAEKHKEDLGEGGSKPEKGESMRKTAAKAASLELPIIKPSPEVIEALLNGDVAKFNEIRPAGRLELSGIDLSKRSLVGIDLRYCELSRANFRGADLSGALLQNSNLSRAILEGTTLTDAKLVNSNLEYSNLSRVVDARGAQFANSVLAYADMKHSNFDGSLFDDAKAPMADLSHSNFRGASMPRMVLGRAIVHMATFDGALMSEARLFQARGKDVSFKGTILIGAEATESQFSSSNQKADGDKVLQTTFEGAWTDGFIHNNAIAPELLAKANDQGFPPEGLLPKSAEVDKGKVLIDNIPGTDKVLFDSAMAELNSLIGLQAFKKMIPELFSHLKVSLARERLGLPAFERKLHYVVVGPPGVGKTTCSRIMGKLFRAMGLLKDGHVIETDKSGVIAGYAGQTLSKTNELVDDALGGSLILDEIYALTESKNDDYAKDAIVVLVKRLWDDRKEFAAFFLGYPGPMKDFIAANPGFDRRMAGIIELPPNTSGELVQIFSSKMKKMALSYDTEMLAQVSVIMAIHKELKQERFGNAGAVENFVEDLSKQMSSRLNREGSLNDKVKLTTATAEDIPVDKYAKLPFDKLPRLTDLHWIDSEGKTYKFKDLPKDGEFPDLSPDSLELVRGLVKKHDLVDISTEH